MRSNRDWWCTMCKYKIYGSKDRCTKCHSRRPGAGAPTITVPSHPLPAAASIVRPGDWACTGCHVSNHAYRLECFKCHKAKAVPEVVATAGAHECVICLEPKLEVLFEPCGHIITCTTCAPGVDMCPLCRAAIVKRTRVFLG